MKWGDSLMKKDSETKRVQVTLPLERYQALRQQAQKEQKELRSIPARFRQIQKVSLPTQEQH